MLVDGDCGIFGCWVSFRETYTFYFAILFFGNMVETLIG